MKDQKERVKVKSIDYNGSKISYVNTGNVLNIEDSLPQIIV